MANFSISNDTFEPLTFQQLDILANFFISLTNGLQEEFLIKSDFLKDYQSQVILNEVEILNIIENWKNLQLLMIAAEEELQQLDINLNLLEEYCECQHLECPKECYHRLSFKTEWETFTDLFIKTDFKICQLQNLPFLMNEAIRTCKMSQNPYNVVISILNSHYEILNHMEKNMHKVMDKILFVSEKSKCLNLQYNKSHLTHLKNKKPQRLL